MTATVPEELKTDGLYSIADTARMLEVCRKTVYNMIEEKKLDMKYRKSNLKRYVTGASIQRVIESVYF